MSRKPMSVPPPEVSAAIHVHADANQISNRVRRTNGALIVMTELVAKGPLSVSVCLPHHGQIGAILEQVGGTCEKRLESNRRRTSKPSAHDINFAPPGVRLWTESDKVRSCRSISLVFEPETLVSQLQDDTQWTMPDEPWLGLRCEPVARLLRLLALDFDTRGTLGELYTESLVVAISARLRRHFTRCEPTLAGKGLSATELKRVLEFIEDNLCERIHLRDMVQLTGMSQSRFYAAFKRSTGLPPYRYQLDARIKRAQAQMLAKSNANLAEVAHHYGFADQAHFGRIFRSFVGETPRAWLKKRQG